MSSNKQVVLVKRPVGAIVKGESFRIEDKPRLGESDLEDGQVLLETIYLSLDPALRGMLMDTRSYVPPVQVGAVMAGATICKVAASKSGRFEAGRFASARVGWTEQAIVHDSTPGLTQIQLPAGAKLTDTLGVLGPTGLTAYFGLVEVGRIEAGDFVVVSGAAGATGSVVCQIAKIMGAKVLGIAGTDDKVAWLKQLGCDEALNYKSANYAEEFKEKTKDLIDLYWDNVGGEILELALEQAAQNARFVMCGGISTYNDKEQRGTKNLMMITKMRIRMEGFIVYDFAAKFGQALPLLAKWLAEGKIQRKETILPGGIEAAEQGLIDLYSGINTGKLLVQIGQE